MEDSEMKSAAITFPVLAFLIIQFLNPVLKTASAQTVDSLAAPCMGRLGTSLQVINPAPVSFAMVYGLHALPLGAKQATGWIGVELGKDWNLVPGADKQPLLNLNTSIGGGYPFALVQASLRYFTSQSLYFVFGVKYQRDFVEYLSYSAWASDEYRIETAHFFQNTFLTFGVGTRGIDRFIEFAAHISLQAGFLDMKSPGYAGYDPGPPYSTTKSRYYSLSFRMGFDL
jgi:hypothetical protein